MKCPACSCTMTELTVADIKVDVCQSGCHGIWLDNYELEKVDEAHESAGEKLLDYSPERSHVIDHSAKHNCPRCKNMVMHRHYFSVRKEVEIDDCPGCGGTWLDAHEISKIRSEFKTENERKQAAADYFSNLFGDEMKARLAESKAKTKQARKFARALKYILPSYWIPGNQDWGAF